MTTIRSGAPRIASTSSAATTQAPTKAATTQAQSTGYASASSFQAATGSGSGGSVKEIFSRAQSALDGLDSSSARDDLKKLLEKPIPDKKGLEEAMNKFQELQQSGADPAELKKIEAALCYQLAGRSTLDRLQQASEKMLNDIANKTKERG